MTQSGRLPHILDGPQRARDLCLGASHRDSCFGGIQYPEDNFKSTFALTKEEDKY